MSVLHSIKEIVLQDLCQISDGESEILRVFENPVSIAKQPFRIKVESPIHHIASALKLIFTQRSLPDRFDI